MKLQQCSGLLLAIIILIGCSKDEETPIGSVSNISPESGGAGTQVIITGNGFGANLSDNVVKINGKEAVLATASTAQLVAVVPEGAGTGPVTIQVNGKVITGPVFTYLEGQVTKTYYLKFKMNGSWKVFESGTQVYESCGQCACSYLPPLEDDNAGISICQANNDWVVAADIESWDKKTIQFPDNVYPYAEFGFTENGVSYDTDYATNQTGSSVSITKVESDGSYFGKKAYKITGTFQCKVAESSGASDVLITEGQLVVRFSED